MGVSLSNQMCFGQYNYPNLYVGEILLLRLLATTTFTCSSTSPMLGGGARIIHSSKSMGHFILQYKMIPSLHELLIAEYSRIFIQVP